MVQHGRVWFVLATRRISKTGGMWMFRCSWLLSLLPVETGGFATSESGSGFPSPVAALPILPEEGCDFYA